MIKKLSIVLVVILMLSTTVFAAEVKLAWDKNTENDLRGYIVYRSTTAGGPYVQVGDDVLAPTSTFTDVDVEDGTYFYVVTAYDNDGGESGYSNEVSTRIDTTPPAEPQNLLVEAINLAIQSLEKYKEYLGALRIE